MAMQSGLGKQTRKIFSDTVALYRNDLLKLMERPKPLIYAAVGFGLFWLLVNLL